MKQHKQVTQPAVETDLKVTVDPLSVGRGHRVLPRGGMHATAKKASRARAKAQWRRQQAREGAVVAVGIAMSNGLLV